jgi:hypothetical protein
MIKSRRMRWTGYAACMRENRTAYRVLMGKPEGKRPLGRLTFRWEYNIEVDLRVIGYGWGGGWTGFIWLSIEMSGGLLLSW